LLKILHQRGCEEVRQGGLGADITAAVEAAGAGGAVSLISGAAIVLGGAVK
jgi:hypothetical protein